MQGIIEVQLLCEADDLCEEPTPGMRRAIWLEPGTLKPNIAVLLFPENTIVPKKIKYLYPDRTSGAGGLIEWLEKGRIFPAEPLWVLRPHVMMGCSSQCLRIRGAKHRYQLTARRYLSVNWKKKVSDQFCRGPSKNKINASVKFGDGRRIGGVREGEGWQDRELCWWSVFG